MYQLISDGGCDFTKSDIEAHNISVVPFYISFDHENYLMEGRDITKDDYFARLVSEKKLFPKTSQPNPQDYIDKITPFLEDEQDIIILTISSKLSGSYASAAIASDMLKEDFPDRKIVLFDSLSASIGQNLILREMIKMRDAGFDIDDTVRVAEQVRNTTRAYFTLSTLEYLKRGGRVGSTTALVGGILGLNPILQLDDGMITRFDKVRGKNAAIKLMEDTLVAALKDESQNIEINIGHIHRDDEAEALRLSSEASLGIDISNPLIYIGATIGTHSGPGVLAITYCRKFNAIESERSTMEKYGITCLIDESDIGALPAKTKGAA